MAQHIVNEAPITGNPSPVPFSFRDHEIRTVVNGDGKPWFVARDICCALALDWSGKTLSAIPKEWRGMGKLPIRQKSGRVVQSNIAIISEPAVYKLAFRSNKPEADEFTNWVASEVLPAIRQCGKYEVQPEPQPALSRRSTAKDRNRMAALMDTYIGALGVSPSPEAYKAAWRKIHKLCGVKEIAHLTVDQVAQAEVFLQALIDAAQPKALPSSAGDTWSKPDPRKPLPLKSIYDDFSHLLSMVRKTETALFNRRCQIGRLRTEDNLKAHAAERHLRDAPGTMARTGATMIEEGLHILYAAAELTEAMVTLGKPY